MAPLRRPDRRCYYFIIIIIIIIIIIVIVIVIVIIIIVVIVIIVSITVTSEFSDESNLSDFKWKCSDHSTIVYFHCKVPSES